MWVGNNAKEVLRILNNLRRKNLKITDAYNSLVEEYKVLNNYINYIKNNIRNTTATIDE